MEGVGGVIVDVLRVGDRVQFEGADWTVGAVTGGRVVLRGPLGRERVLSGSEVAQVEVAVSSGDARVPLRDLAAFEELSAADREQVLWWEQHVRDVMLGRDWDGSGPNYDPSLTSMRQREETKAAELTAAGHEVSRSRIVRQRKRFQTQGLMGLLDGRKRRPRQAGARVDPRVREALAAVLRDSLLESSGTFERLQMDVIAAVRAQYGEQAVELVPSHWTLRRMVEQMREGRHATGSARTRRTLSQQPQREFGRVSPVMPGELVQVDSTPLDVAVVLDEGLVGRVELTAMVDVATRTIMAVAVRPTTKAADLGALLAHAVTPEPMRPGWPEALRLSRSVLPYEALVSLDERLAAAAARPVIRPQTIVMDHGKQYTSRAFERACRHFGINIQPAHPDTPTDKPHVERTLQSVSTMFVQYLPGYLGRSVERRGQRAQEQAVLTLPQVQDLLEQWIVAK